MTQHISQKDETGYYLGIDWGRSRCGLAIADDEVRIASALGEFTTEAVQSKVMDMASEYPIKTMVVGVPDVTGQYDSSTREDIDQFVAQLKQAGFSVEVEAEFFSTKMAISNLVQAGKQLAGKQDNAEAARVILQGWIDKQAKK